MTDSKRPQSKKKATPKAEQADQQTYLGVGIVFAVVGLTMLLNDQMRAAGVPFMVLGFTFLAISKQKPSDSKDD